MRARKCFEDGEPKKNGDEWFKTEQRRQTKKRVMSQLRTIVNQSNLLRSWLLNSGKRRVYASQEELLALESEAKKQKPHRSEHPRAAVSQMDELAGSSQLDPATSPLNPASSPVHEQGAAGFSETRAREPNIGEQTVLIIVDQRMTMRFGERRTAKSVVASKTAAFLAWEAVLQGKSVGAIIFDDQKILKLQPQCSRLRVRLILHALLNQTHQSSQPARPRSNLARLNEVLRRTERIAPGNFLIFLISDVSGYNEQTSCIVERLSRRNNFLIVRVYDPRQALHLAYSVPVESSRRRLEADWSEPWAEAHGWRTEIGHWPFPPEVPVIPLNSQRNLTQQLHRIWRSLETLSPGGKTHCPEFAKDWDRTLAIRSEKAPWPQPQ